MSTLIATGLGRCSMMCAKTELKLADECCVLARCGARLRPVHHADGADLDDPRGMARRSREIADVGAEEGDGGVRAAINLGRDEWVGEMQGVLIQFDTAGVDPEHWAELLHTDSDHAR